MKIWRTVAQRKVWSEKWGFGIVTAERSDGVLGVQFYSDPWVVHHLDPSEVEEAEQASFLLAARPCARLAALQISTDPRYFFLRKIF